MSLYPPLSGSNHSTALPWSSQEPSEALLTLTLAPSQGKTDVRLKPHWASKPLQLPNLTGRLDGHLLQSWRTCAALTASSLAVCCQPPFQVSSSLAAFYAPFSHLILPVGLYKTPNMPRQTLTHPIDSSRMLGGAGDEFPEGHKVTPKVELAKYCGVNRSLLDPSRRLSGYFPIEFAASLELITPHTHLYPQILNPQCGLFSFSHPAQDHLTCQVAEMNCQGAGGNGRERPYHSPCSLPEVHIFC